MKKKSKLFLSMASMFFAVALLCFGVYAALGVSYTISGSVVYQVKDVFVNIQTSLYMSKDTSLTDQETLDGNVALFETNPKNAQTTTNTEKLSYSDGLSTYNPDTGVITNSGEAVSKTSANIPINYGSYEAGAKGFAYYIVVSITNYGTESVSVTLTNNINNEQTNSFTKLSQNTTIAGRTGDKAYTTKHIVIGMALNDATKSVRDVTFNVPILIEKYDPLKPTLEKLTFSLIDGDTAYEVKKNGTISGKVVIPSTYNGKPVTSIGDDAFWHCSSLTEITIPDGVESIGDDAFRYCSSLTDITIPDSVTSIGSRAFSDCDNLTEITIPDSVISIGYSVFDNCYRIVQIRNLSEKTLTGLESNLGQEILTDATTPFTNTLETTEDGVVLFTINNEVDNNGIYIFGYTGQETQLNMSNISAKGIYQYAFYGNKKITSAKLPNTIKSIVNYAFTYCSNLTDITIPDGVESIGDDAFRHCSSLTDITIPDSVESIGRYAFSDCSSLTDITIPNGVKSIGYSAFNNCSSLTDITIPDSVTSIGGRAFYNCSSLTQITIPGSVTSIGDWAFYNCSSLTDITIPNSVETIGDYAFYNCSSLTDITIPGSVTSIGDWAFSDCRSLTDITIPDSVETIGSSAFLGCSSLIDITIPNSVETIGSSAFWGCYKLVQIRNLSGQTLSGLPSNLGQEIITSATTPFTNTLETTGDGVVLFTINNESDNNGVYIFGYSGQETQLNMSNIPANSLYERSFYENKKITSIILPNTITDIENYAFYGCSSLTDITIPNSVESIGSSAFNGCTSLEPTVTENNIQYLGSAANYYLYLWKVVDKTQQTYAINLKTKIIGESAFSGCSSLTDITIPNGVTRIGGSAFSGCSSLTEITIPNSVQSIGYDSFSGCQFTTVNYTTSGTGYKFNNGTLTISSMTDRPAWYNANINPLVLEVVWNCQPTSIGISAFDGCSSLREITIPTSVTTIAYCSFSECISLTNITIPEKVSRIGQSVFEYCTNLNTVTIDSQYTYKNAGYSYEDCGELIARAEVVYVKKTLTGTNWYLDDDELYTKVDNGNGYWKYTRTN